MKKIETSRFGEIEIEKNRIIIFPEGLIGFPDEREYAILEHKPGSSFYWLQSTEQPELAFVMTNPFLLKQDYLQDLSADEAFHFEKKNGADIVVFVLITIPPGNINNMTANLLGPLVIDSETRQGKQVILANSGYDTRFPVLSASS